MVSVAVFVAIKRLETDKLVVTCLTIRKDAGSTPAVSTTFGRV